MKKELMRFFYNEYKPNIGWLNEFSIVEDCSTKVKTVMCRIHYIDGVERRFEYIISEFEYEWKINIGDLIGANL